MNIWPLYFKYHRLYTNPTMSITTNFYYLPELKFFILCKLHVHKSLNYKALIACTMFICVCLCMFPLHMCAFCHQTNSYHDIRQKESSLFNEVFFLHCKMSEKNIWICLFFKHIFFLPFVYFPQILVVIVREWWVMDGMVWSDKWIYTNIDELCRFCIWVPVCAWQWNAIVGNNFGLK